MTLVVYLYGFVPSGTAAPDGRVAGLEGSPVRVLDLGPFAAAVSFLDAADYGQGVLEARLKDMTWVAHRGAVHETVVTWFSDQASIVPARLLTVFSSESALREEAVRREEAIATGLARFRELREWDLKVSYDMETLSSHLGSLSQATAALDTEIAGAAPGRRYLLERRRADVVRAEAGGVVRGLAQNLLDDLRHLAEEVSELDNPLGQGEAPVVLNAALLVRRKDALELEGAAAPTITKLEGLGVHVVLTGPWAPYRFVGERSGG